MIGGKSTGALALVAALAACGTASDEGPGLAGTLGAAAKSAVLQRTSKAEAPAAPADPAAMAAEALRVNPGPLILAGLEGMGTTQVLAMMSDNAGMRTYMTKNQQALILRNGMLVGTRGLGHDMASADAAATLALVRAGRAGQAQRVIRYYSGDGLERPLPFSCDIAKGAKAGLMVETCQGNGATFQNNYLVSGGAIGVSRQWAGPGLGYITIQTLRP